jgi:hypothetical protein
MKSHYEISLQNYAAKSIPFHKGIWHEHEEAKRTNSHKEIPSWQE